MLRPNKGEGERPSTTTNKDKRPLAKAVICPTVVFLAVSPILLAQQATFASPFSPSQQQLQTQPQKGQAFLRQPQPGMNPSLGKTLSPRQSPSTSASKEELAAQLATLKATLTQTQTKLNQANQKKSSAFSALQSAKSALQSATQKVQAAQAAKDTASANLQTAKATVAKAQATLEAADAALKQQTDITETAQAALEAAQAESTTAAANLQAAQQAYDAAVSTLSTKTSLKESAASNLETKQAAMQLALTNFNTARAASQAAQQRIQEAEQAYNQSQIPNPNYVPPTYTTQPTSYQIPDANFQTGAPWIGDGSGQSGAPEVHPGHIHFSYIGTEVYQDILISPREIANYTYTVAVWNQDQNTTGYQGLTPDTYSLRIYFYDANDNLIHQNSVTSSEIHSWRDVTLQGNTGTTIPVSKVRIGIYGIDNGFWAGTYGPAANNVRLTLGWITGTTQSPTITGTIPVQINEGGEATFTAPNGGVFTSSDLRYEAIDRPECGTNITPQLGSNTITLAASNGVWGDPCGGWYKHITGTLTYTASEPQFIKDPALLQNVQALQAEWNNTYRPAEVAAYITYLDALNAYTTANQQNAQLTSEVAAATTSTQTTQAQLTSAQTIYDSAEEAVDEADATFTQETAKLTAAQQELNASKDALTSATSTLVSAMSEEAASTTTLQQAQSEQATATTSTQTAEQSFTAASTEATTAQTELTSITTQVADLELQIKNYPEPTPTPTPTPTPEPKPEPEKPVIVVLPPLDDLTKVNFEAITPTDLTPAQAEEIKQAALETFQTAEAGSPAYEAALEALYVAAQADDIVVSEELAAIPGVGAAAVAVAQVLNLLSNVGADMNPVVREQAQQATVAAVIVGQVAQAAVAATASASITRKP